MSQSIKCVHCERLVHTSTSTKIITCPECAKEKAKEFKAKHPALAAWEREEAVHVVQ